MSGTRQGSSVVPVPLIEATAWLATLDLCFAAVKTLPEAFADANVLARGMLMADELGRQHIAPVIRFADEPARPCLVEPRLGAHSAEILEPLGPPPAGEK